MAFDPFYLPKSGKHTPHKGTFYSGCLGRATGGIEIGGLAVVDLTHNTAFNLEDIQTPSPKELKAKGLNLVNYYAQLIVDRSKQIREISKYLAVDGYFAKLKYIHKIKNSTDLEIICKLGQDANLKYLYKGPKRKGRGRPKKHDGKVNTKNIDKRRFQIEFLYRDVKQFIGLTHCQARSENKLYFLNMAFNISSQEHDYDREIFIVSIANCGLIISETAKFQKDKIVKLNWIFEE